MVDLKDTIVALSSPSGSGAIAMIRMSGNDSISIIDKFVNKNISNQASHTAHFVVFKEGESIIDECVVTLFKSPKTYTTEDIVEITCHASPYIINRIIISLTKAGARMASPGEFTQRAYIYGQMDLSQAEAVGDLIASTSAAQHQIAFNQMKGGVSDKVQKLRSKLIEFASLIELENDFGEEDLEFADRSALRAQVDEALMFVNNLQASFEYGNAIKEGVPVAIVGRPNVGKSTLLNSLLQEDKAIVSDIPGTTRDVIEDTLHVEGHLFRFIDTAGIRDTDDEVESLGIKKTFQQIEKAKIVLFLAEFSEDFEQIVSDFKSIEISESQNCIILLNKVDLYDHTCHSYDVEEAVSTLTGRTKSILISAKNGEGVMDLRSELVNIVNSFKGHDQSTIISNMRHFQSLEHTKTSLIDVKTGLETDIPSDLIAIDLRRALNHLGEISGEISTDDLLDSIFSNFCIGK
tara:strand:+ start:5729 stop:7117 length:1389 start_codon:yes stop_codon:yes gene_type:complete